MYNFRLKNNYIFCDLPDGRVAEGHCKNVEFHLTNHTPTCFVSVKNLNNWDGLVIPFNVVKVEGQALNITAFIEWATLNTGNYGILQAPAVDYTPLLQSIIDKLDLLKPLLIEIDNNTDTLEVSNDAVVVNTQEIENKLDLLKPAFEIAIELVDGANGSNVGVDFTYTIPQSIHQMSIVSEVKIGTATGKGSNSANYTYSAGVLQVFSVGTMNGEYIWINGTKI